LKNPRIVLRVVVLFCTNLNSLGAQPWTREVQGVVMDQHSHPLEHAVVQIKNDGTAMILSYITQADGKYHFAGLDRDYDYELTAEYDGIRSRTRILSKFNEREEPRNRPGNSSW
jgi:Carboxypeptidase regulatory-like domain